jgi:Arc/MetJ-type ribon-helix-helix transcriptional regulator
MRKMNKLKRPLAAEFTAVKMEPDLYKKAKRRARSRYQSYSEYVRQLIVRDVAEKAEQAATIAAAQH